MGLEEFDHSAFQLIDFHWRMMVKPSLFQGPTKPAFLAYQTSLTKSCAVLQLLSVIVTYAMMMSAWQVCDGLQRHTKRFPDRRDALLDFCLYAVHLGIFVLPLSCQRLKLRNCCREGYD